MMTITTSSSRSVKPKLRRLRAAPCFFIVSMLPSRLRVPQRAFCLPMVVKDAPVRQWAGALGVRVEAPSRLVGVCGTSARALLGEQRAVDAQYGGHVVPGLGEGRNAVAVALHRIFAGVVRGERQLEVVAITCHQVAQVVDSCLDVLFRVEGVRD